MTNFLTPNLLAPSKKGQCAAQLKRDSPYRNALETYYAHNEINKHFAMSQFFLLQKCLRSNKLWASIPNFTCPRSPSQVKTLHQHEVIADLLGCAQTWAWTVNQPHHTNNNQDATMREELKSCLQFWEFDEQIEVIFLSISMSMYIGHIYQFRTYYL